MPVTDEHRWLREPLADGMDRLWRLDEVIFEGKTQFQDMIIARSAQGISLFCGDERQSTEFSQVTYHEALIVPALLLADKVDRVLIIGSSEGVASQMAVAAGATVVDHVDIDEECVRLCAEHLPYGYTTAELNAAVAGEGPVKVHFADGYKWVVDGKPGSYDIVLVDLPDEQDGVDAQHNRLYGAEFLAQCKALLTEGGVVAGQAGCQTMWRNATLGKMLDRFDQVCDTVALYASDEHEWAYLFGRADKVEDPTQLMIDRLPRLGFTPESIDAEALRANGVRPFRLRHR
ncbi:spermidine synthase [Pseudonocardiaceae bacterium YIM PH 21723]|nr:spermidine synthase [Pseudonocardiaceae bacterium YIM PH 21723]